MNSTIVLLLLVATQARDKDRATSAKDRHQLQMHVALAYLGFRDDRIVEYTLHSDVLKHSEAVQYCRRPGDIIAQPGSRDEFAHGFKYDCEHFT